MKSACVLMLLFTAGCFATAQTNAALAGLTLRHTILITGGGQAGSTAGISCSTVNCSTKIPLLPIWNVFCEAQSGQTCTFALHVDAGVVVSRNDNAFYRATAAGAVGPPLNNMIYLSLPRDANGFGHGMASFTFVFQVKNTAGNQFHRVEFDLGCQDADGSGGCSVASVGGTSNTVAATLRIDVFTP